MKERRDVLATFDRLRRLGGSAVLASIVATEGSTYRRPGARLLIPGDGEPAGLISGGCLESDLLLRAQDVAGTGAPKMVVYDSRDDQDRILGMGLGCRGMIRVLLERVSGHEPGPLLYEAQCVASRRRGAIATVVEGGDLGARWMMDTSAHAWHGAPPPVRDALEATREDGDVRRVSIHEAGPETVLVEPVIPNLQLIVLGGGPDAEPLVEMASGLGWDIQLWDHRPALATPERFPQASVLCSRAADVEKTIRVDERTAVVVMTHNFERDREILKSILPGTAPFIAVLGPRSRTEEIMTGLSKERLAIGRDRLEALHSPAGLDLGSEGGAAIALSVLAEIQAHFSGRSGEPLRDQLGPIGGATDAPRRHP